MVLNGESFSGFWVSGANDFPFAEEAKLTDIRYLSDYKAGDFGRATGLLVDELKLLARAVVIVDRQGVVQYIQVVPEITHLPDMEGAFEKAIALEKER